MAEELTQHECELEDLLSRIVPTINPHAVCLFEPGSLERIAVYRKRVELGLTLERPGDYSTYWWRHNERLESGLKTSKYSTKSRGDRCAGRNNVPALDCLEYSPNTTSNDRFGVTLDDGRHLSAVPVPDAAQALYAAQVPVGARSRQTDRR